MAKFELGAIVTDVAGSIGGTTLRRGVRGHSMYNKQKRILSNSITNNSMRLKIGNVMRSWGSLSVEEQAVWNSQALNFKFSDKFGKDVKLTGRQLFIKLTTQALIYPAIEIDVKSLSSDVQQPIIDDVNCIYSANECIVNFQSELTDGYMAIALKQKPKSGGVKPHAHFRVQQVSAGAVGLSYDIWDLINSQFPFLQVGQYYELHIYYLNNSGFTSAVTAFKFVVQ